MPKYGSQIDTQKIPVKGLTPEQGTAFPGSPSEGQMFHRTDLKTSWQYLNSSWVQLDSSGSTPKARTITAGTGLTGGGDLSADRTLAVDFAGAGVTTAGKVVGANDARLSDARTPTAHSHVQSDITGLAASLAAKADVTYVDAAVQGYSNKTSVKAASTGNLTLSGTQTVDGVALGVGDRALAKDQTTGSTNGIYVVASGAWTRAGDADTSAEIKSAYVWVEQGTVNADSGWLMVTDNVTLGTTAQVWTQTSGAGQVVAGNGLSKTGNSLDVNVGTGLSILADYIKLDPSYQIPLTQGGTGAIDAAGARTNLGATTLYKNLIAALTPGTWTNVATAGSTGSGNPGGVPQFRDSTTLEEVVLDNRWIDNAGIYYLQARADVAYASGALYVVLGAY